MRLFSARGLPGAPEFALRAPFLTMLPVLLLLLLSAFAPAAARKGEKGKTPILGWNTWCTYAHRPSPLSLRTLSGGGAVLLRRQDSCGVDWCTSKEILSVATEIKTSGLQAIGYDHINRECGPPTGHSGSAPLTGRTCPCLRSRRLLGRARQHHAPDHRRPGALPGGHARLHQEVARDGALLSSFRPRISAALKRAAALRRISSSGSTLISGPRAATTRSPAATGTTRRTPPLSRSGKWTT